MSSWDALWRGWEALWWDGVPTAAWQSALTGCLLLAVAYLLRRRSATLRYGLLALVLLKFATPPMVAFPTGLFAYTSFPGVEQGLLLSPMPFTEPVREATGAGDAVVSSAVSPSTTVEPAAIPAPLVNQGEAGHEPFHCWALPLVHLLGMLAVVSWVIHSRIRLRRLCAGAVKAEGALYEEFAALARGLGIRRRVRLLLSPENIAPMAFGILRPAVLIPARLHECMEHNELLAILVHELAHHRRKDPRFLWIENVLIAIWWFHPVLWLTVRAIRKVREDCCDDIVLHTRIVDGEAYCGSLLHTAAIIGAGAWTAAPVGASVRLHPLKHRIAHIMDQTCRRRPMLPVSVLVALCVLALVILPGKNTDTGIIDWLYRAVGEMRITGRVISTEGTPIAGATVKTESWKDNWGEENAPPVAEATTNRNGKFSLNITRNARCKLTANAEGYYGGEIEVPDGRLLKGIQVTLGKGVTLSGRAITRGGTPIPFAQVYCSRREDEPPLQPGQMKIVANIFSKSDAAGHFVVNHIGPGRYGFDVYVEREYCKYQQPSVSEPVRVEQDVPIEGIDVVFNEPESERIEGYVRDENGTPVPYATLDAINHWGLHWGAKTDLLGHYRIIGVGDNSLSINCSPPESLEGFFPSVQIKDVRVGTLDANITMPHRGRISGVVKDTDSGKPIPNAEVRIARYEPQYNVVPGWYDEHPGATTDADGTFVLSNLIAGKVVLAISAPGYMDEQALDVVVQPGTAMPDLELRLTSGANVKGNPPEDPAQCAVITGTVLNTENRPINAEQGIYLEYLDKPVHEVPAGYVIHDGKYRLDRLRPGKYEIKAWVRGRGHATEQRHIIQTLPGQVTQADFVLDFPARAENPERQ